MTKDKARRWIVVVALAVMLGVLGLLVILLAAIGKPSIAGHIAFQSDRDGNWELYVMNADGSGQTGLTHTPDAEEWLPRWSPAGAPGDDRLAFVSDRNGGWDIYVLGISAAMAGDEAGSTVRLTEDPSDDWDPTWSPDGEQIAFSSLRNGNWEVYVLAVPSEPGTGAGDGQAVNLTDHPAEDWLPAWSPDGQHLAFVTDRDGNWEIYSLSLGGSEQTNLTNHGADDWVPVWSPGGGRLAFQSDRDGNWEIYVLDLESGAQTNLTSHPADDWDPAWSPDGRWIAFMSLRDGNREIYVMDATGVNEPIRLTDHPAADKNPTWGP